MDVVSKEVEVNVKEYFKENLPRYEVLEIRRKSYHPDDSYLYMVVAKKDDGTYTVWTSWNELLHTLNHGHYDLPDLETCDRIMDEFYNGQE